MRHGLLRTVAALAALAVPTVLMVQAALIVQMAWAGDPRAGDTGASRDRIMALYYAAGVATYCSGLTERAVDGLRHAVERERADTPLDDSAVVAARNHGYVAADYEWSNRGLGGFRRWCRSEGDAATHWLEALVETPYAPLPSSIRQPVIR